MLFKAAGGASRQSNVKSDIIHKAASHAGDPCLRRRRGTALGPGPRGPPGGPGRTTAPLQRWQCMLGQRVVVTSATEPSPDVRTPRRAVLSQSGVLRGRRRAQRRSCAPAWLKSSQCRHGSCSNKQPASEGCGLESSQAPSAAARCASLGPAPRFRTERRRAQHRRRGIGNAVCALRFF